MYHFCEKLLSEWVEMGVSTLLWIACINLRVKFNLIKANDLVFSSLLGLETLTGNLAAIYSKKLNVGNTKKTESMPLVIIPNQLSNTRC